MDYLQTKEEFKQKAIKYFEDELERPLTEIEVAVVRISFEYGVYFCSYEAGKDILSGLSKQ